MTHQDQANAVNTYQTQKNIVVIKNTKGLIKFSLSDNPMKQQKRHEAITGAPYKSFYIASYKTHEKAVQKIGRLQRNFAKKRIAGGWYEAKMGQVIQSIETKKKKGIRPVFVGAAIKTNDAPNSTDLSMDLSMVLSHLKTLQKVVVTTGMDLNPSDISNLTSTPLAILKEKVAIPTVASEQKKPLNELITFLEAFTETAAVFCQKIEENDALELFEVFADNLMGKIKGLTN